MFINKRRIVAEAEIDPQIDAPVEDVDDVEIPEEGAGEVTVDEEATDLLFEADDVAQLVAEVTGEDVDVTSDAGTGTVTFGVGDQEFTVEPEGDEEILEARKMPKKPAVKASTTSKKKRFSPASKKAVSASKKTRTVRRAAK